MKKLWDNLKKHSTWVVMIILLIMFFPAAFYRDAQTDVKAIMTAVGIDKSEDEYEVSCLMVIPTSVENPSNELHLVSAKGISVSEAFYQLNKNLGKEIGLAHCDMIILNDEAIQQDITKTIDFFIREYNITKKAYIVNCPDGAKELLNAIVNDKALDTLLVTNLIYNNNSAVLGIGNDVDKIYRLYFSKSGVNYINVLNLEEEQSQGGESQTQSGGKSDTGMQSGSDGGSSKSQKKLSNKSGVAFLKNGIKTCEIEDEEALMFGIYSKDAKEGYLKLENITDGDKTNAFVMIDLVKIVNNNTYDFKEGKPTITCNMTLVAALHEIMDDHTTIEEVDNAKTHIGDVVKTAIKDTLNKLANNLLELSKESNTDIYGFYDHFYKKHNKEWKEYINSLENPEEYLENCEIKLNILIKDKF